MAVNDTIQKALEGLREERQRIDAAITQLERLSDGAARPVRRGPGRPPKTPAKTPAKAAAKAAAKPAKKAPAARSTNGWTAAKRKAAALRMKKYWADKRKASATK